MEEIKKEMSEEQLMGKLLVDRFSDLLFWIRRENEKRDDGEITSDEIFDLKEILEKIVEACGTVGCYLKRKEMEAE